MSVPAVGCVWGCVCGGLCLQERRREFGATCRIGVKQKHIDVVSHVKKAYQLCDLRWKGSEKQGTVDGRKAIAWLGVVLCGRVTTALCRSRTLSM